jgi:hypothetical protein
VPLVFVRQAIFGWRLDHARGNQTGQRLAGLHVRLFGNANGEVRTSFCEQKGSPPEGSKKTLIPGGCDGVEAKARRNQSFLVLFFKKERLLPH